MWGLRSVVPPPPRMAPTYLPICSGLRTALVAIAVSAVLLIGWVVPSSAQAQDVVANCDFPDGRDSCNRWYTTPWVSISWQPDPGGMIVSGCAAETFTAEMTAVERSCRVDWSGSTESRKVWIGIDRSPPTVISFNSDRPPDYNGWFNHAVGLGFQGTDSVSGIASCSSTIFGGPEGAGVLVAGSCTDRAGNSAVGAVPINYDTTPPSPPSVDALPGRRKVRVSWTTSPGTTSEVVRLARKQAPVLIYQGTGDAVTDRRLRNGRRYRYVVTQIDQAGNRAAAGASAVPTASPLLLPSAGARIKLANSPPRLVWKRVRGASYYNVQVFRGSRKILSAWPERPRRSLERRWTYAGTHFRLTTGRYCWHVWPGYGKPSRRNYGKRLGTSCFRIIG
jgi:hypothetical protein